MNGDKTVFSGHQPNFLPYMGFFYKMYRSDVFVLDDDVQYSRSGLHNANFIKVNGEKCRITVPVRYEHGDPINLVRICEDKPWADKMLKTFRMNYGKTPHFDEVYNLIERRFKMGYDYLSELNIALIQDIANGFGFGCEIVIAGQQLPTELTNNERNLYQCLALGGKVYYSGIGGKEYNDESMYWRNGIDLVYSDYKPVKYHQTGKGFIENLSAVDYIFNMGFTLPPEWAKPSLGRCAASKRLGEKFGNFGI